MQLNRIVIGLVTFGISSLLLGCSTSRTPIEPGTVPYQDTYNYADEAYGREVYQELSKQYPPSYDRRKHDLVNSVVRRLAKAAGAGDNPWHTYIFQADDVMNAAATRGNYIFVWTGLFPATRSEDELASVLAHEIGHVLARHPEPTPQEAASQMMVGVAGIAAQQGLAQVAPYGAQIGAQIVSSLFEAAIVNPESQRKELEADHVGLFLMARAGYSPDAAYSFWQRVNNDPRLGGGSGGAPSFFSTHPSNEERIQQIGSLLPEARKQVGWQPSFPNRVKEPRVPAWYESKGFDHRDSSFSSPVEGHQSYGYDNSQYDEGFDRNRRRHFNPFREDDPYKDDTASPRRRR